MSDFHASNSVTDLPDDPYYDESRKKYCPVCGRDIVPIREWDSQDMEYAYIYVHDDIVHTNQDLDAFDAGVQ